MNKYTEFENAIKEAEAKRKELREIENKTKLLAALVVANASLPSEPVDVADIINQIGKGVSVEKIASEDPLLNEGKINGYEGEYTAEIKKNAERLRKTIALALTVLAKGATGGI